MNDCGEAHAVRRCLACGTLFEEDVADELHGLQRCPQCFLTESEPFVEEEEDDPFVVRHTTKFR